MSTLSDSLTVGILLALIFGALGFYLYSRLGQNEKRVSLLENLLLSLKMSTEASLSGPDSVEPVSSPAPLQEEDVDTVDEEKYADLLKELPSSSSSSSASATDGVSQENEATELLRAMSLAEPRKMDGNYESMSAKELQALVKQRGLSAPSQRKKDLIDTLKNQGQVPQPSVSSDVTAALSPEPAASGSQEVQGADMGVEGFFVQ
jgi:hypothetical protein